MVKKDLNTRGKNSILKFAQFEKGFSPNHWTSLKKCMVFQWS
jgi:hypothetical protein